MALCKFYGKTVQCTVALLYIKRGQLSKLYLSDSVSVLMTTAYSGLTAVESDFCLGMLIYDKLVVV